MGLAIFRWYSLAATHSPAATVASQNGHSNAAETIMLTVTPCVIPLGRVLVVVPASGMFRLSRSWKIRVMANRRITKAITLNNGLL